MALDLNQGRDETPGDESELTRDHRVDDPGDLDRATEEPAPAVSVSRRPQRQHLQTCEQPRPDLGSTHLRAVMARCGNETCRQSGGKCSRSGQPYLCCSGLVDPHTSNVGGSSRSDNAENSPLRRYLGTRPFSVA